MNVCALSDELEIALVDARSRTREIPAPTPEEAARLVLEATQAMRRPEARVSRPVPLLLRALSAIGLA